MTSPLKPWETCSAGRPSSSATAGPVNNSSWEDNFAGGGALPNGPIGQPSLGVSVPPTIPPRPSQQPLVGGSGYGYGSAYGSAYGSPISPLYSRYGYGGGGYGYGGGYYGTGGLYGAGGLYGTGGSYGAGPLQQLAEESTRGAFHSVEAVVQAFASVSLLLESTYQALYSSFRAVVGVADQFGRLRLHLAQTLSALALVRSLRWLFLRAWLLLRGRRADLTEAAWSQASSAGGTLPLPSAAPSGDGSSSWPIVAFFGFVVGAPWLLWRIFAAAARRETRWALGVDDHFAAVAQYDFQAEGPNELALTAGQELRLAPRELQPRVRGWLLASVDGSRTGLVPANYVKVLGLRTPGKDTTAAAESAPPPP
uniref:Peroxisomal membrane protein PEX13 n=1 Tax=Amblyomma aureolatum TaxID=187763 RepID=A0A1E1XGK5_9ACAR